MTLIGASREYCTNIVRQRYTIVIAASHLCALGKEGKPACHGDSGAPLMAINETDANAKYWYLAGVTSYGHEPCRSVDIPRIYTRVSHHYDWILTKLRD